MRNPPHSGGSPPIVKPVCSDCGGSVLLRGTICNSCWISSIEEACNSSQRTPDIMINIYPVKSSG